jgi:hypothetical protein
MTSEFLFCEIYRPQTIDDYVLPDNNKKNLRG